MSNYTVSYDDTYYDYNAEVKGMTVKFTGPFFGLQIKRFMKYNSKHYKSYVFYIEVVNLDGLHTKYYNSLCLQDIDMFSQYSHFYVMIYGYRRNINRNCMINAFKSEISNGKEPKYVTPEGSEKEFLYKQLNPKSFLCEFKCVLSNDDAVYHFIVTKLPDSFLIKRKDDATIPHNVYREILARFNPNVFDFNIGRCTLKLEGLTKFGYGGTEIMALILYYYSVGIGFPNYLPVLFDRVVHSLDEE